MLGEGEAKTYNIDHILQTTASSKKFEVSFTSTT